MGSLAMEEGLKVSPRLTHEYEAAIVQHPPYIMLLPSVSILWATCADVTTTLTHNKAIILNRAPGQASEIAPNGRRAAIYMVIHDSVSILLVSPFTIIDA